MCLKKITSACLLSLLLLLPVNAVAQSSTPDFSGKDVLFHEPFDNADNFDIEIIESKQSQRYRDQFGDVITFSLADIPGPGSLASVPGTRTPAVFSDAETNYFVGRLAAAKGTVALKDFVDVTNKTDVEIFLKLAATEDTDGFLLQNHFDNKDSLELSLTVLFDGGSMRTKRLDLFTGGNPLKDENFDRKQSPLQSRGLVFDSTAFDSLVEHHRKLSNRPKK